MKQFDTVKATFRPKRTDDLKTEVIQDIGKEGTFQACWIIEEGDYKDQWAMVPYRMSDRMNFTFGWVPLEDLELRA